METESNAGKPRRGRRTKMTPETVQKLREVFLLDYSVEEACDHAQIAKQTYYNECNRNPSFMDEMERAQRGLGMAAKRVIAIEIIEKKNAQIAMAFLKRRQPERYRTRVMVDAQSFGV